MADVINYSILKCLFTEMSSGLGLVAINSQHFPVLFESQPLCGGWVSWVRCSHPSLTEGLEPRMEEVVGILRLPPISAPSYHTHSWRIPGQRDEWIFFSKLPAR